MTEADWLACTDAADMLLQLRSRASTRKMRLFMCACRRAISPLAPDREIVDQAEEAADAADHPEVIRELREKYGYEWSILDPFPRANAWLMTRGRNGERDPAITIPLIRDIFGNPFRRLTIRPAWRTPTVLRLAQAFYTGKSPDHLPILGDALEDAGCENREILDHCRQTGPHVRGCWLVDLLLKKK